MTNPTTEPTQSIRDRLARAACYGDDTLAGGCRCTDEAACIDWVAYESVVDAILSELMEPSEGMIDAAREWAVSDDGPGFWQAMIQHIRDGGK